jgi:hypothetical protein
MPRSWACNLLGIEEAAPADEAEKSAEKLTKTLQELGQFTDGRLAHSDARRAQRFLEDAVDVLSSPKQATGVLEAVPVTRAIGLRDLKKPRSIVQSVPHFDIVQLDRVGSYKFMLVSTATAVLSNKELVARVQSFPRQPKIASLILAQDAASKHKECRAPRCASLASAVVGVFDVDNEKAPEPPTKKARTDTGDKIRCLHILLKHKDLKLVKDPESVSRLRGKTVTRTLPQAERELLDLQRKLAVDPNIFHTLARKHSECDSALQPGINSGDLGWVAPGTFGNPTFEEAMFALKPYEVSDIVSTPRGLHLIQRIA